METIDLIIKAEEKAIAIIARAEENREVSILEIQEAINQKLKNLSGETAPEVNSILQKSENEIKKIENIEIEKMTKEIIVLESKIKQNTKEAVSFVFDKINGRKQD